MGHGTDRGTAGTKARCEVLCNVDQSTVWTRTMELQAFRSTTKAINLRPIPQCISAADLGEPAHIIYNRIECQP